MLVKSNNILDNFIIIFLTFQLAFMKLSTSSFTRILQIMFLILLYILLAIQSKNINIRINSNKIYFCFLIVYAILVIYSSYINRKNYIFTNTLYNSIVYSISLVLILSAMHYIVQAGLTRQLVISFWKLMLFFCLLNDILFVVRFHSAIASQNYLLGGKFDVAYAHIELICFYYTYLKISKEKMNFHSYFITIILTLYSIIICYLVNCMTGVTGTVVAAIAMFLLPARLLIQPLVWLLTLLASSSFSLFYENLLGVPWIRFLIINILHRSETLTGRTFIYAKLPLILYNHWTWGYGYGTSYEVCENTISMPNSQNGITECILEQGAIATCLLIIILTIAFYISKKGNNWKYLHGLLAGIYAYTILTSIEITLSTSLISLIFLMCELSQFNWSQKESLNENHKELYI